MSNRWWDLRWWLRRECLAIQRLEQFDGGVCIFLCSRRRWHRGECTR